MGRCKPAVAVDDFHFALFGQLLETAGELAHHFVFVTAQLIQIDVGFVECHADIVKLRCFVNHLGGVQQGF